MSCIAFWGIPFRWHSLFAVCVSQSTIFGNLYWNWARKRETGRERHGENRGRKWECLSHLTKNRFITTIFSIFFPILVICDFNISNRSRNRLLLLAILRLYNSIVNCLWPQMFYITFSHTGTANAKCMKKRRIKSSRHVCSIFSFRFWSNWVHSMKFNYTQNNKRTELYCKTYIGTTHFQHKTYIQYICTCTSPFPIHKTKKIFPTQYIRLWRMVRKFPQFFYSSIVCIAGYWTPADVSVDHILISNQEFLVEKVNLLWLNIEFDRAYMSEMWKWNEKLLRVDQFEKSCTPHMSITLPIHVCHRNVLMISVVSLTHSSYY